MTDADGEAGPGIWMSVPVLDRLNHDDNRIELRIRAELHGGIPSAGVCVRFGSSPPKRYAGTPRASAGT